MSGTKKRPKPSSAKTKPGHAIVTLIREMDGCPTAEDLNDRVIVPFVTALESVCQARGYVLNIYGQTSNLVVSTEVGAAGLYDVIDAYLDQDFDASGRGT